MSDSASLADVFEGLRPSIVAFGSRIAISPPGQHPLIPTIVGTGFIVDQRGIAVTNNHVIQALQKLPPHPVTGEKSAFALLFTKLRQIDERYRLHTLYVGIRG